MCFLIKEREKIKTTNSNLQKTNIPFRGHLQGQMKMESFIGCLLKVKQRGATFHFQKGLGHSYKGSVPSCLC